jgi:hypothetical protein
VGSTCSEEPVPELPVAGSSRSEAQAADMSPVPTTSCATKYERAKHHSEFLTSAPVKAGFIGEKMVDKKKGKLMKERIENPRKN